MCKRPVRHTFIHEARRCLGASGHQEGDGRPESGPRGLLVPGRRGRCPRGRGGSAWLAGPPCRGRPPGRAGRRRRRTAAAERSGRTGAARAAPARAPRAAARRGRVPAGHIRTELFQVSGRCLNRDFPEFRASDSRPEPSGPSPPGRPPPRPARDVHIRLHIPDDAAPPATCVASWAHAAVAAIPGAGGLAPGCLSREPGRRAGGGLRGGEALAMLAGGLQRGMSTAETMVGETSVTQRLLGTAAARAGDLALLGGPGDIPGPGLSYPDLAVTLQRAAAGLAWRGRPAPRRGRRLRRRRGCPTCWPVTRSGPPAGCPRRSRPAWRSPRSPASWPTAGRGC